MNLPEKNKIPNESSEKRTFSFESNYSLVYISVIAFFIGSFFAAFYGFKTVLTIFALTRILAGSIAFAYLIQHYFFRTIFPMKKSEYFMFSAFGVAPLLTALYLILNFYITLETHTEIYKIDELSFRGKYQYFTAPGLPCENYPELCTVHVDDLELRRGNKIEVTMAKGIGGLEVLKNVKLTAK
jgi:hypothetical protein